MFRSTMAELDAHLLEGKHKYSSSVSYDAVKMNVAKRRKNVDSEISVLRSFEAIVNQCHTSSSIRSEDSIAQSYNMGRAVKKKKPPTRFSEKQKDYLITQFLKGENSGRKVNPAAVENDMKKFSQDGKNVFSADEYLKKTQIASFFSRFTAQRKKRTDGNEDTIEVSDEENDEIDPSNKHHSFENMDDSLEEDDYGVQDDKIIVLIIVYEVREEQDEVNVHLSFLRNVKELYDDYPDHSAFVLSNHDNDNQTDVSQREKK